MHSCCSVYASSIAQNCKRASVFSPSTPSEMNAPDKLFSPPPLMLEWCPLGGPFMTFMGGCLEFIPGRGLPLLTQPCLPVCSLERLQQITLLQNIFALPSFYYFLHFEFPQLGIPMSKVLFGGFFLLVHTQFPSLSFSKLFISNSVLLGPRTWVISNFTCGLSDSKLVPANPTDQDLCQCPWLMHVHCQDGIIPVDGFFKTTAFCQQRKNN